MKTLPDIALLSRNISMMRKGDFKLITQHTNKSKKASAKKLFVVSQILQQLSSFASELILLKCLFIDTKNLTVLVPV